MKINQLINTAKTCTSMPSQFLGLMFHVQKPPILFVFNKEKRISLHTFFVFYPIDIYFLNKNKKIIETKQMNPFSVYFSKTKPKYILETKSPKSIKFNSKIFLRKKALRFVFLRVLKMILRIIT